MVGIIKLRKANRQDLRKFTFFCFKNVYVCWQITILEEDALDVSVLAKKNIRHPSVFYCSLFITIQGPEPRALLENGLPLSYIL